MNTFQAILPKIHAHFLNGSVILDPRCLDPDRPPLLASLPASHFLNPQTHGPVTTNESCREWSQMKPLVSLH